MKIQPELYPLIESGEQVSSKAMRLEFIKECERLDLYLEYFTRENITKEQVDMLAQLHRSCYSEYSPEESLNYVNESIAFNGFHVFLLSREGRAVAANWFDDGEPHHRSVTQLKEYYNYSRGSDLVIYTVQVMTAPDYRGFRLSLGLNLLVRDFCNTVFNGPPLLVSRVADDN